MWKFIQVYLSGTGGVEEMIKKETNMQNWQIILTKSVVVEGKHQEPKALGRTNPLEEPVSTSRSNKFYCISVLFMNSVRIFPSKDVNPPRMPS